VIGPQTRSLAGSRWAWERGHHEGPPPPLDLELHGAIAGLVRELVHDGRVAGLHDAADGMGVALAEMAVRSGVGFDVSFTGADHAWLFAESASRVVVCTRNGHADEVVRAAQASGVPAARIGSAGGDRLVVKGLLDVALADAVAAWRGRLPDALGSGSTH
jgi:phosphoribosylformylglycinamidine synthase